MQLDTEIDKGLRDIVASARQEADMKILRGFDIDTDGFIGSGVIAGIVAHAGVADHAEAFLIAFAIVISDRANFVIAGAESVRCDLESDGFAIAIARKGERSLNGR